MTPATHEFLRRLALALTFIACAYGLLSLFIGRKK